MKISCINVGLFPMRTQQWSHIKADTATELYDIVILWKYHPLPVRCHPLPKYTLFSNIHVTREKVR